ncbi:hypothetical protein BT69DRAFT_676232 [Atractiella rhizophila]|nr:hypothetical protein BT69DRAFT_676232 [Atractiella rhizophila]
MAARLREILMVTRVLMQHAVLPGYILKLFDGTLIQVFLPGRRPLQTAPIASLPIELLFQIFYILLPPVSHIQNLNQEFTSHFRVFAGICATFRIIALSTLQRYCVLFEDNFSSYTLNTIYLENMAVNHGLMKRGKYAKLTLGCPFPPSHKSWSHILNAMAKQAHIRELDVYNLPWDGFDLPDMLRSIFSLRPATSGLGLFFQNQQPELSLGEILRFPSNSLGLTISGLVSARPGQSRGGPFFANRYEYLHLLQCGLCDIDFSGRKELCQLYALTFSSFYHLSAEGFGTMLRIFQPSDLCCAFQQLSDSAEGNPVSCLRRPVDHELHAWVSDSCYRLYLDGGREDSNLISDTFLETKGELGNLGEIVLLYCHFSAGTVCNFLSNVAQLQKRRSRSQAYPHLVVQLKPFFGDCDFSPSWFSRAFGPFHSLVAESSVKLFNERYDQPHPFKHPLQYDSSRSGTVFSFFCEQGEFPIDIWFIDQDDEPGNEDSLFFWQNFESNKSLRS